jgi:hypothetical protein
MVTDNFVPFRAEALEFGVDLQYPLLEANNKYIAGLE